MSVTWEGLAELHAWLRTLPETLVTEASGIVEHRAELAKSQALGGYPPGTELREKIDVKTLSAGTLGVSFQVVNTSKLAAIYEFGTEARHTAFGWNRGRMPARPVFIPAMTRHRALMYEELAAMMRAQGLTVTGRA